MAEVEIEQQFLYTKDRDSTHPLSIKYFGSASTEKGL